MHFKNIITIILILFMITSVYGLSTSTRSNLNVKGYFNHTNATHPFLVAGNMIVSSSFINLTTGIYYGDGGGLTNISAFAIPDIWVNITGDTMTGNLNMTDNNITDVDMVFANEFCTNSTNCFGSIKTYSNSINVSSGNGLHVTTVSFNLDEIKQIDITPPNSTVFKMEVVENITNITKLNRFTYLNNLSYRSQFITSDNLKFNISGATLDGIYDMVIYYE